MRTLLLLVIVMLMTACSAWAISFDVWKTGLSKQDMISLARQHNLPLAKDGRHHNSKTFDRSLLAGGTNTFFYFTTLLDHTARVRLFLSPDKGGYGQFIYEIEILFVDSRKIRDLHPYLINLLKNKYGPGKRVFDMARKVLAWGPEKDGEVRLIKTPGSLQLIYTDVKIKTFANKLSKSTYDLPNKPLGHKDAGRF